MHGYGLTSFYRLTYVFYIYLEGGITWTQATGDATPAGVSVSCTDGTGTTQSSSLPGSGTTDVALLHTLTNVNTTGLFIFQVDTAVRVPGRRDSLDNRFAIRMRAKRSTNVLNFCHKQLFYQRRRKRQAQ